MHKNSCRFSRKQYWIRMLFFLPLLLASLIVAKAGQISTLNQSGLNLFSLPFFIIYFFYIRTSVYRLHDINRTGHWCWLMLFIFPLLIFPIFIGFSKTFPKENQWGLPNNTPTAN